MGPQNDDQSTDSASGPFSSAPAPVTPAPEAASSLVAPMNFGLLFQQPDTDVRAPRQDEHSERSQREDRSRRDESSGDSQDSDRGSSDNSSGGRSSGRPAGDDDGEGDDGQQAGKSRRRGGRGRRNKSNDASDGESNSSDAQASGDNNSDADGGRDDGGRGDDTRGGGTTAGGRAGAGKSHKSSARNGGSRSDAKGESVGEDSDDNAGSDGGSGPEASGGDTGDADGSSSRRRTRRRRRSGSGGDSDDPPGTVTKVREPRKERDEVTSIKGSTRLEAKKQRRREGREAGRRRTVITEAEFLARRESVERVMVVRELDGRTQIGVLEDGMLAEHYVSRETQSASMAGNVYLGRVQNVLPSMEAAFVDIGRGRNAVLYAGEVNWDAAGLDNQPRRIEHALKSGESVLVQVTKDPIGHKGARLTSQISLPGRFLVYVPGNSMTGISRKLPDTERARLKKILKDIVPSDAGVIVRTAAEGASEEDLRADVERLQKIWEQIESKSKTANAPSLLHGEPDLTVRVIRDVFNEDFSKLIVSGNNAWAQVSDYLESVAPDLAERLEKWTGETDVFSVYRIDEQLAKAMDRKVWLPSGGSLIIDRTEAMTVIDVNTGKFVGSGGNLEETVTKNNLEAAEEIVRQMRLRDIGGIIVVDFIDMVLESNRDLVVRRLVECLGRDRTKHQVAEVTSLGLVQMTRKRVGSGLVEIFSEPCTACAGRGIIIHDHPVDKGGNHGGGSNGGGSHGSGGKGGNHGGGRSRSKSKNKSGEDQAAQQSAGGPTAAQIAAAAHKAAMTAGDKASPQEVAEAVEEAVALAAAGTTDAAETRHTERRSESAHQAHQGDQLEQAVQVPVDRPVVRPRRKRKRVVAPAGPPTGAAATEVTQVSETEIASGQAPDLAEPTSAE